MAALATVPRRWMHPSEFGMMSRVSSGQTTTLTAHTLRRTVEFCKERGHDPEELCQSAGLRWSVLQQSNLRIPWSIARDLCLRALDLTGDEHFGLHLAHDVEDESQYDSGVLALMASENLGAALAMMDRNARYWGDGRRTRLERVEGGLAVLSLMPGPVDRFARHSHECALAEVVLGARKLCKLAVRPRVVRFSHDAPGCLAEHHRVFACPLEFSSSRNEVIFDDDALLVPMRSANPDFLRVFERQLERALLPLPACVSAADLVTALLRAACGHGGLDLRATARHLSMSERTLQRRLREEHTSFVEILDSVRQDLAVAHLARGASLDQIASLLGYSDTTSLHHAFKRWTGRAPSELRRR